MRTSVIRPPARWALGGVLVGAALFGVVGAAYAAIYEGTDGDDSITVARSGSTAFLRGGDDTFEGARGRQEGPGDEEYGGGDEVFGGDGNDVIRTHTYVDSLRGQAGGDKLKGGADNDALRGGSGSDTLIGGGGADLFKPGKGHDTCIGNRKDNRFPGGCEVVEIVGD